MRFPPRRMRDADAASPTVLVCAAKKCGGGIKGSINYNLLILGSFLGLPRGLADFTRLL